MKYLPLASLLISMVMLSCSSKQEKENKQVQAENQTAQDSNTSTPSVLAETNDSAIQNLDKFYHSDKLNWTLELPEGWKPISKEQLSANDAQAESFHDENDNPVQMQKMEYLVAVQKDDYHLLTAAIERYTEAYPGEYESVFKDIKNDLYNAFRSQKINIDTTSGKQTIAGLSFYYYKTGIYDKSYMLIMNQIMFVTMYKGYDFTINISYRDENEFRMLMGLLNKSKFE